MQYAEDVRRWPMSMFWTVGGWGGVPPRREFMIGGIFLSPLNTPISPSHSPRAHAAAELAVDSRSICTRDAEKEKPSVKVRVQASGAGLHYHNAVQFANLTSWVVFYSGGSHSNTSSNHYSINMTRLTSQTENTVMLELERSPHLYLSWTFCLISCKESWEMSRSR